MNELPIVPKGKLTTPSCSYRWTNDVGESFFGHYHENGCFYSDEKSRPSGGYTDLAVKKYGRDWLPPRRAVSWEPIAPNEQRDAQSSYKSTKGAKEALNG